ncbi:MAG: tetratricopeptide repeat protein [Melioribacter sp.]|nr:tetratricopeptide repeat protein [Melioribacter sp.]
MLTKGQIRYINQNRHKLSPEKLSSNLKLPIEEIQKYLELNPAQKAPFYFYLIMILIPILFLIVLEVGLRLFNYGTDLSMWIKATEGKLMLNPEVARRYFSTIKSPPSSIEDIFDEEKKDNSYRVFVLGESSAAGYPYMPLGSFSRYIRKRLELSYPQNKIEVINISLTAVNSYTVRDFIPEVLKQKPDLILIYTGHNEYYGALGVGSLESLGNSRSLVNLILYLNKFKTTQLVRDFIQWIAKIFTGDDSKSSGTLMSRMAKEQTITFNSDNYKAGIEQFRSNMRDVVESVKKVNVPIILGTLASNLKDQKPFISVQDKKYEPAEKIYEKAQQVYSLSNYKSADSLFRLAKDLDALRFRAPEEINNIIKNFGNEFNIPIVNVDSVFDAVSPNGIVGDNLMTDHLHPTLHGYQLIGKIYYDEMNKNNFLPKNISPSINYSEQDQITISRFPYSKMDSTISAYRIKLLKNDWPYIDPKNKIPLTKLIIPHTYEDTLALKLVNDDINWIECHQKAAERNLHNRNIDGFLQQMEILIYQYPVIVEYYNYIDQLALDLLKIKDFEKAYKVLLKRYQIKPSELSTKWLGTIDLNSSRIPSAIKYLEESVSLNPNDNQTLYNLAGAYALNKDYRKSYDVISKVLNSDPNFPGAQNLLQQIKNLLNK